MEKIYKNRVDLAIYLNRYQLEYLDELRGKTPRGKYISEMVGGITPIAKSYPHNYGVTLGISMDLAAVEAIDRLKNGLSRSKYIAHLINAAWENNE